MISVIGVGDNTLDTYMHMRTRFPGGNALNVAVLAHRCGAASPAAYLGCVGDDEPGKWLLKSLQEEDVDISHCKVTREAATAFVEVTLIDGERVWGKSNKGGASSKISLTPEDFEYIRGFDWVHTSVFSGLEDSMAKLREYSKYLTFDFSTDYQEKEYIQKVLPYVDLGLFSFSDKSTGELMQIAQELRAIHPCSLLITQGSQGSWLFSGTECYHQEIYRIDKVIDTMGAGDAFTACFVSNWRNGDSIQESMQKAAEFAAKNCLHYGSFEHGMPF